MSPEEWTGVGLTPWVHAVAWSEDSADTWDQPLRDLVADLEAELVLEPAIEQAEDCYAFLAAHMDPGVLAKCVKRRARAIVAQRVALQ